MAEHTPENPEPLGAFTRSNPFIPDIALQPAKPENDLKVIEDEDALQAEVNGLVEAEEEAFLFDSFVVTSLDFSDLDEKTFRPAITPANPGDGLRVRSLGSGDYDRGFVPLLQQLTKFDSYDKATFLSKHNLIWRPIMD